MLAMAEPTTNKYSLSPSWGFVYAAHDQALARLAGAIIVQAAIDARRDDYTGAAARDWLQSVECWELSQFIGLDFNAVEAWVEKGCPAWRKGTAPIGAMDQTTATPILEGD